MRLPLLATLSLAAIAAGAQVPRVTLVSTIGCGECGGPAEFGALLDIAVDDSGGVLVITNDAPFIRRFDARGRSLWATGAAGSGPGEYRRATWAMLSPDGAQVVDMSARRVTHLDATGTHRTSVPFRGFPAAVSAEGRSGAFVILVDDFRGGYRLERFAAGDSGRPHFALPPASAPRAPGAIVFTALAVAGDGAVAFARDVNAYRIEQFGRDGRPLRVLTRDIPQLSRSAEEVAAQEQLRARTAARAAARVAAERGAAPPGSAAPSPRSSGDPELKPHIAIDGLQFDDGGRLWVRTMRGDHTVMILDLFSPSGTYLGEVGLAGATGPFALAGQWLAVAAETDDGYPVVRVYSVR